jgi:rfaE bifunctional protein nucleotidyltransferase chain/domain
MNAPILDLSTCARMVESWRQQGLTIVFTNGHFDLLHAGHAHYLQAARSLGDRLVVGLNSDASARRRKGPTRPILPEEERALLLAALRAVDAVLVWDEDDFRNVVKALRPDIYVKGADWNQPDAPQPPEAAIVEHLGGRIAFVEMVTGRSTSAIVQDILERHGCKPEDAS